MNIQLLNLYNNFLISKPRFKKTDKTTPVLKTLEKDTVQISFGEKYCTVDNFQVKKLKDLRCPVCSKLMLSDEEIDSFVEDIASKKGEELANALEKYEDDSIFLKEKTKEKTSIYRPIEQEAVDIIKNLAIKYPEKDLSELFLIKRQDSLEKLIPVQLEILQEYVDFATKNTDNEEQEDKIKKLTEEYTKQIKGKSDEHFSRKKFVYAAIHVFQDKKTQNEVNKIVQKLPNSQNNVDAFFVKQTSQTTDPKTLARILVSKNTSTTEHLQPKSMGGGNRTSNYITDCASCNMKRSNMPFDKWTDTIPDFEENLQEYVEIVQKAIDDGKLDKDYDSYPEDIVQAIENLSNDKIKLRLPESTNPETIKKNIQKRRNYVENLRQDLQRKQKAKELLKKEIEEAESLPFLDFAIQHQTVTSKISSLEERLKSLDTEIKIVKSKQRKQNKQKNLSNQTKLQELKTEKQEKEKELEKLKIKEMELSTKYPQISDIEQEMSVLSAKINNLKRIDEITDSYNKNCMKEESIHQKIKETKEKIRTIQEINRIIIRRNPHSKDDKTYYLELKHNEILLKYIESATSKEDNKKIGKYQDEVFNIAQKTIEKRQKELLAMDSVVYFENQNSIKNLQYTLNSLNNSLEETTKEKNRMRSLIERYKTISKEGTIEDFEKQYEKLKERKRRLLNLEKVVILRQKHKELEKICTQKEQFISKLRNYETLTNEEFRQLTNQAS